MKSAKNLSQVKDGESVAVAFVPEGDIGQRLEAMGIREGKILQKISQMPLNGPVTVSCDRRQFAVSSGVAQKITVKEITNNELS